MLVEIEHLPISLSLSKDWIKYVIFLPAIGMCLMQLPITYPSAWKIIINIAFTHKFKK